MFVSSFMADLAKLSVASRASQCNQLVAHWYCFCVLCAFFQLHIFSFFIESCSFVDETSPIDRSCAVCSKDPTGM